MRLIRERGSNLTEIIPYLMMFTSSNQQKKPQIFKEGRVTFKSYLTYNYVSGWYFVIFTLDLP